MNRIRDGSGTFATDTMKDSDSIAGAPTRTRTADLTDNGPIT